MNGFFVRNKFVLLNSETDQSTAVLKTSIGVSGAKFYHKKEQEGLPLGNGFFVLKKCQNLWLKRLLVKRYQN